MDEKITITIHVTSPGKNMGKFRYRINLFADEPVTEHMNMPAILYRHHVPDFEAMLAFAIREYLEINEK